MCAMISAALGDLRRPDEEEEEEARRRASAATERRDDDDDDDDDVKSRRRRVLTDGLCRSPLYSRRVVCARNWGRRSPRSEIGNRLCSDASAIGRQQLPLIRH